MRATVGPAKSSNSVEPVGPIRAASSSNRAWTLLLGRLGRGSACLLVNGSKWIMSGMGRRFFSASRWR
eukprot:3598031-Alexandrium_andersonii.AAC.1